MVQVTGIRKLWSNLLRSPSKAAVYSRALLNSVVYSIKADLTNRNEKKTLLSLARPFCDTPISILLAILMAKFCGGRAAWWRKSFCIVGAFSSVAPVGVFISESKLESSWELPFQVAKKRFALLPPLRNQRIGDGS